MRSVHEAHEEPMCPASEVRTSLVEIRFMMDTMDTLAKHALKDAGDYTCTMHTEERAG